MIIYPKFKSLLILLYFFVLVILTQEIYAGQKVSFPDSSKYTFIDIKAGDLCIVCDMKINVNKGYAFLFDGRRVTLDIKHFKDFINNPEKYFHKLQPNAALYDEKFFQEYQISYGWFIFAVWILLALISSAFCVNLSLKKGMKIRKCFYIGLFANIFGLLYLKLKFKNQSVDLPKKLGKISVTSTPVNCNNCGAYVHPSSKKCNECGVSLEAHVTPETDKV